MLQLKNIVKDYVTGDTVVKALKGVDIQFRESEFVSILGQSGCGKTTLLNIIGGLDRYTDGDLIINGKSTKDFKDKDWDTYRNHSIGFVFQNYNLIPHQTVLSNVELALTLSGVSKAERRQRAIDVLNRVGLGDQLHKKPNQMSGGQMQRVAIARALINDPDILLADEPTGALDSETSVQIMEILKEISHNKLIVMVTHNPELAQEYSSRIIRLLDGKVIDDSNPYEAPQIKPEKKEKAAKKDKKKGKKTSMSFFTALSLSRNNLMTKKARTFLTSFAGSIGIIGIALILSLSNGVQVYIDQVQEDTLSSYPLQITQTTTNFSEYMTAMTGEAADKVDHDKDKVYSRNMIANQIKSFLEETKVNNLEKFKEYLDDNKELESLTSDIQYSYSTPLYIYKSDTSEGLTQVNPSTLITDMGMYSEDQLSAVSSMGGSMDVWTEMIDNDEIIENQYDVLAGKLPENYDEVVLVVDENNEINDYVLYTLGLLDSSELNGIMKKVMLGEEININSEQQIYTYDQLMELEFKLISPADKYCKEGEIWKDMSNDEDYMKSVVDKGTTLKIVGIVRPSEKASSASIGGAIGYRHDLTTYVLDKVGESEIVKEQQNNPDIDIFTGLKFATDEDLASKEVKVVSQETAESQEQASQMLSMGSSMDISAMTDTQKAYFQSLTDEQLALIQQMMQEEQAGSQTATDKVKQVSDSDYDTNMEKIGYAVEEKPSSINIYPKDFESKERIVELIDEYNQDSAEVDQIEYTDYVGLMMSSITTIINAISYVLIAFVAISLVVSSIMIGIITYISVLERTKEIGILRSIGASKKDISRVFNAETLIVGFVAGMIGVGISYLFTIPINAIIAHLVDVPLRASIPVAAAVILVAISMVLTLIAGLFPSKIAAKKDPVVALRTE